MSEQPTRAGSFRALVKNRDVVRLVTAYAAFSLCEYGFWIVMLVFAYGRGGATTAGLVAVAQLLPSAAVASVVGPLAERRSPVVVLLGGYLVQAVASAATATLLLTGSPDLVVYLGAALVSSAMAPIRACQAALVPALVTETDELTACNVLIGWVESASIVLCGLAVGVALELGGPGHAYSAGALLLAGATVLVWPLRRLSRTRTPTSNQSATGRWSREARLLWGQRPTRLLVSLLGAENVVVGALDVLFVVLAIDLLEAGQPWAGYLNAAYGGGALVLGTVAALLVGRRLGPYAVVVALLLGTTLSLTAFTGLAAVVVLLALTGGSRSLFDVIVRVLLQRSVPPERIPALFGFAEALNLIGLAVGSLLAPALIAMGGPRIAVVGTALVLPVLVLARARLLLRIDDHARVPVVQIALLRQIRLFQLLPVEQVEALAHSMQRVEFSSGQDLVREGEPGDFYYAIADGAVEVSQGGRAIASLGRADGLGEIALLRAVPRTATASASGPVTAYRLDRDAFLSAMTGHPPSLVAAERAVVETRDRDAGRRPPRLGES